MLNKSITLSIVAAVAALLMPSKADAYGAAHYGYTHVGSNGVYHTGRTVASTPTGVYGAGHTSAYRAGGGAYHSSSGGAYHSGYGGAYHYNYSYSSGSHYGYYR